MKFTDIIVLLDRSESMSRTAADTRLSFNQFLTAQKEQTTDDARLTLMQFSGPADYAFTYHNHGIKVVNGLTPITYNPTGSSTALRDAMRRLIDERGREYASLARENRPEKVVFVVITDGLDNASQTPASVVKELVEHQTEKYQWTFIYLGAGHDAITTAVNYGFIKEQSLEYSPDRINYTSSVLSDNVTCLRSATVGAYTVNFTDDIRKKAKE